MRRGGYSNCCLFRMVNKPGLAGRSANVKNYKSGAALALAALMLVAAGCAEPEHRMNVAASRDDTRRSEFEHCRAQGRTDCDAILNAPVNSNTPRGETVREQE